ncbi:MAG: hypothetical protein KGL59_01180 [Acidobacteriota bacterium]|nr:hypothetical protein [Acidobacteriota bacterium]
MTLTRLEWVYAGSAAGALGAGGLAVWLWARRRRDPQEAERRRREYVSRVGRITQAEILEVVEHEAEPPRPSRQVLFHSSLAAATTRSVRRLILYRYTISGVRYETAQELTGILFDVPLPAQGRVVSVKYDPAHPGNSILVAENWSGLREQGPSAAGPGKRR